MNKKIGLFWLRDDFRFSKNKGLIEATINHDKVVVFYLYKPNTYRQQEAQKWWLSKSLINFRKERLLENKSFNDENDLNSHIKIIEDEIKITNKDLRMRELKNWLNLIANV